MYEYTCLYKALAMLYKVLSFYRFSLQSTQVKSSSQIIKTITFIADIKGILWSTTEMQQ